jgi:hypothetical protein
MEILEAYRQIAARHELPTMEHGSYESVAPRSFADPQLLWAALVAAEPKQGWLQFQSKQLPFREGLPQPQDHWGYLLAMEAVDARGRCILVNPDGAGGWRLSFHEHRNHGDLLWDQVVQLAHDPATGRLRYRRYWKYDTEQGYVQVLACFTGFQGE